MKRHTLWLILLVLFLLEGSLLPWFLPATWQSSVRVAPHFVYIVILYYAIFLDRHTALMYGIIFGLLTDFVYYGHMLGVHSFSMGVISYLIGKVFSNARLNIFWTMTAIAFGSVLYDFTYYGLYRLFNVVHDSAGWMLTNVSLPSLAVNMLFALLIYVPLRHWLQGMQSRSVSED